MKKGFLSSDMHYFSTKAIIVQTIPYKENSFVVQALTQQMGFMSFFLKKKSIAAPSLVDLQYKKGKGLFSIQDLTLLDQYEPIRTSFETIKHVSKMLRYIARTQMPGRTSVELFQLVHQLLLWSTTPSRSRLCFCIFLMKLLKYEGGFLIKNSCSYCKQDLKHCFISNDLWLCDQHKQPDSVEYTEKQIDVMRTLVNSKSSTTLLALEVDEAITNKLEQLFVSVLQLEQGKTDDTRSGQRNFNPIPKL